MATTTIIAPFVLFLDDGVHVFASVARAEQHLEAIDVRNHPQWRGFDSQCHGIRLDVIAVERKVWGMTRKEERVKLRFDRSISLAEASDTIIDQMREYLFGINDLGDEKGATQLSTREMFDQILCKAAENGLGPGK